MPRGTRTRRSNDKTNEDKAGSADEPPKAHERQAYDAEVEAQLSAVLATNRRTATPFVVDKTTREASRNWDRFYKLHADRFFKDRHWTSREFGSQIGGSSAGDPASPPASATASTASTTAAGAKRGGEDDREEEARFVAGREAGESGDGDGDGDGDGEEKVLLEVGCGVGNMLFPLLEADPKLKVHCCDFSQRAIEIVKAHPNYDAARVNAFVYDLTSSDPPLSSFLSTPQTAGWKPITTISMIFVLSAIPPQLHASTLASMVTLLRHQLSLLGPTLPDGTPTRGHLILRDYAHGDLSQVRYHTKKDAGWAEPSLLDAQRPWYKRGDNTFNYFFTRDELDALARQVGITGEVESIYRTAVNRKRAEGRQRRFVQAKWTVEP
ncbi:related to ABP140 - actin binding protein and AdoMet-dependent tRNA methyltransferase [Pseudozyma flocculosa]|uniref:tRNA N(3)-methylcytidine methyltransferase n=1 Tax=Pseudozyma flocculosa TaxID=84751 RepID=A0A5C3F716_9BASI|nr:related to ABP140 - actin binding protein and AdoMet-dependent tRNA methyltransferase [Pseudozyma flocculosa]